MTLCVRVEIALTADEFQKSLLTSDAECSYDSVIEINLDTVRLCSLLSCFSLSHNSLMLCVNRFSVTARLEYLFT